MKWEEHTSVEQGWGRHFPSLAICVRHNLIMVKIWLQFEILTALTEQ
jgi:hypothetical protein